VVQVGLWTAEQDSVTVILRGMLRHFCKDLSRDSPGWISKPVDCCDKVNSIGRPTHPTLKSGLWKLRTVHAPPVCLHRVTHQDPLKPTSFTSHTFLFRPVRYTRSSSRQPRIRANRIFCSPQFNVSGMIGQPSTSTFLLTNATAPRVGD
jgi:hypothetical protein